MRGPSKTPPKYRKHKATGQAIVTIDGKDFYLGPHGSKASRTEYDGLIGEWGANGRTMPVQTGSITVTELIAKYWQFAKGYYVKNGKTTDELPGLKIALQVLKQTYGNCSVDEVGPLALVAMQQKFIDRGNCRRYVNQNIGRIKRCFRWGVAQELVPVEVHQRLLTATGLRKGKTAARESRPVLPVSDEVIEQTILAINNLIVADIIRIQRLTGCRPGEVVAIRPCDIDRETVKDIWLYYPESHKMEHKERHRCIVVGPKAQAILAKYFFRDTDRRCFIRNNGEPFEATQYAQAIKRACVKGKIEHWAPNQIRHKTATEVRKTYGLEGSQVVAGHAQASVTQIYAERDLDKAIQIMREVG